jgi:ABC-type multidrug transport system fused ATPase/permease subunit
LRIQKNNSQETLFAVTSGVNSVTVGIIGVSINLVSDFSLLLILILGLFFVDKTIAIFTLVIFAVVAILLYRLMHKRAHYLGYVNSKLSIASNEKILEVLNSFRELKVRDRLSYYGDQIGKSRSELADNIAEMSFMPSISKYVIEITLVIGSITICAIQFMSETASHAVGTLSIFLAAGSRIAPAVLRFQQGFISMRSSFGIANPTLRIIEELSNVSEPTKPIDHFDIKHIGFIGDIEISNIKFTYPGNKIPAINLETLNVRAGSLVAILGPSGAGKTTLVDLLLGVLEPNEGSIKISGINPTMAEQKWPGAISYVPQDVVISNGSVSQNVALGYPQSLVIEELIWNALKTAQLDNFMKALDNNLNTNVGERGTKISGGERQRLGIARAMYTCPKLLVLDESTSSLDGKTESNLSEAIHKLKGNVTVIVIAHRLSTVKDADLVVYLENGKMITSGKFDDVRKIIPDFDTQAKLMGL